LRHPAAEPLSVDSTETADRSCPHPTGSSRSTVRIPRAQYEGYQRGADRRRRHPRPSRL